MARRVQSLDLHELSKLDARSKKRKIEKTYSNSLSDVEKGGSRKDEKRQSKLKRTQERRNSNHANEPKYGSSTTATQSTAGDGDFLTSYTVDLNDTHSKGPPQPLKRVNSGSRSVGGASSHSQSGMPSSSNHSKNSRSGKSRKGRSSSMSLIDSSPSHKWRSAISHAGDACSVRSVSSRSMGKKSKREPTRLSKKRRPVKPPIRRRSMDNQPSSARSARPGLGHSSRLGSMSRSKSLRNSAKADAFQRKKSHVSGRNPETAPKRPLALPSHRSSKAVHPSPTTSTVRRFKIPTAAHLRQQIRQPSKTLILIWMIVAAELAMDLVTTIISFMSLMEDSDCCGQKIDLGPVPLAVTIPFVLLIVAELGCLMRAVFLSLCPTGEQDMVPWHRHSNPAVRSCLYFVQLSSVHLFRFINWLVLLNPFFGAVVAWMLLYQSNEIECFVVLGLEAASLVLHFWSIYLEGERHSLCGIAFQCIPVIPFFVVVVLILVYLQQEGVCYLVQESLFWYSGCQVCDDGRPPINNKCRVGSGNDVQFVEVDVFNSFQGTYCGEEEQFCFFEY